MIWLFRLSPAQYRQARGPCGGTKQEQCAHEGQPALIHGDALQDANLAGNKRTTTVEAR